MARAIARQHSSAIEPLKAPVFRALWTTALIANTGLHVQDVGAAWLMTSLTQEPYMIALMQTAQTLPFFLLAAPAGAMADLVDRRKLIMSSQIWSLLAAVSLAILTVNSLVTPWVLLALTFMLFIGNAVTSPAWNAVTPEIVPRRDLEAAVGLGSAGYNVARGVGSALGGVLIARCGIACAFLTNCLGYLLMINTLRRWQYRRDAAPDQTPEKMGSAMKAGFVYVSQSFVLRSILVRTVMFTVGASVLWALIPLFCRQYLNATSVQYGIVIAAFGAGTLIGAILQPLLRRWLSLDGLANLGTIMFAASLLIIAFNHNIASTTLGMLGCGCAWTTNNSALNIAVQMSAPSWVRARAFSVYLLTFQGCTAGGAALWGAFATWRSIEQAMIVASTLLICGLASNIWHKLSAAEIMESKIQLESRPRALSA